MIHRLTARNMYAICFGPNSYRPNSFSASFPNRPRLFIYFIVYGLRLLPRVTRRRNRCDPLSYRSPSRLSRNRNSEINTNEIIINAIDYAAHERQMSSESSFLVTISITTSTGVYDIYCCRAELFSGDIFAFDSCGACRRNYATDNYDISLEMKINRELRSGFRIRTHDLRYLRSHDVNVDLSLRRTFTSQFRPSVIVIKTNVRRRAIFS